MKNFKNLKIGIIDDDPFIRAVLRKTLSDIDQSGCSIVFELGSLTELSSLQGCLDQPKLIICDINMPGITGIDGIPLLQKRFPKCKIMMHSEIHDKETVINALHCGAQAYLKKGPGREELIIAIRNVMEGYLYISPVFMKSLFETIAYKVFQFKDLSRREQEIADGILKGLSYKMIGYKHHISINTVREHIKNIYKKLNVKSKRELLVLGQSSTCLPAIAPSTLAFTMPFEPRTLDNYTIKNVS